MKFASFSVHCRIWNITRYISVVRDPVENIRILLNFCAFLYDYETLAIIAMLGKANHISVKNASLVILYLFS